MSEDKNTTILNKVRDKIGNGVNRALVTLAFMGCVNALSAKTVVGRVLDLDGTTTYLQTDKGNMKIESGNLVRAVTAVNQKRGEVGVVKLDIDDNTSEVRGGVVYPTGIRATSGVSNIVYDIGSWADDIQKLGNDGRAGNIRRVIGDVADGAVNILPEKVIGEQGSCAYVKGRRIVNGKDKEGWMPMHKRGADGYYMENGGNSSYSNQSRGNYQSSYTNQSGGGSYSQSTRSVSVNQLVKASENRGNGSGYTQNNTSNTGQVFVSNRTRGRFD